MSIIKQYHQILYPEIPTFILPYLESPAMQRLKGIGLFCGVDYSCLFHPQVFYSRYDHSLGVALITWHFTHDRLATLAALFHDVSTPVFSHVIDFKNQDYLSQESTEKANAQMILSDTTILDCLTKDGINPQSILHDDVYPIANQKTPHICADRLEYMFSTGLFLTNSFDLKTVENCYRDLKVMINEDGQEEPSFQTLTIAQTFFHASKAVTQLFLDDKDKITLQLLAQIIDEGLIRGYLKEADLYHKSEQEMITLLRQCEDLTMKKYLKLLTEQDQVLTSEEPLDHCFSCQLKVKVRYIDPLYQKNRLSKYDEQVATTIQNFFKQDSHYINLAYS